MTPQTNDKYLGIEIECIIPSFVEKSEVLNYLRAKFSEHGLSRYVNVGTDVSVSGDIVCGNPYCVEYNDCICGTQHVGVELRVLVKETELTQVMPRVCGVLKKVKAYVNKSCGLHVHLDMRNRDVVECAKRLYKEQDLLLGMVPESRKKNKYCQKITRHQLIKGIIEPALVSRYKVINPTSYHRLRTLEVRVHEGTVKSSDIIKWCKLLVSIADNKVITKREVEYVYSRIKKYA